MNEGDSPVSKRSKTLSAVAWLRNMLRLPGYAIAIRGRRRRLLAAVFLGVAALIWIGSSLPAVLLGPPPPNAFMHGIGEFLMLLFGRVVGNVFLCVAAAVTGALAFAPERRGGAMDQLVMTPAPRGAVFLGRALGAAIPLMPVVVLASAFDLVLPPLATRAAGNVRLLTLVMVVGIGATVGVSTFSVVVWIYSLGLLASLRSRTVTRALVWSLVLLLGVGLLEVGFYFVAGLFAWAGTGGKGFVFCYWLFALLRLIFAALVMRRCVRGFDRMALGEEARAG